ncbi:hypothetical protein BHE74_00045186 [Ensete ventricosum]|nr:hypothetical protein GW17_00034534 [Ensete ventricosum]RWW48719.1 hypothetical protein BHE74_00045186 [Ensete ventricosum]RZR87968.1 hypothetical protein BHM03_00015438 [Ensete ventricosum]
MQLETRLECIGSLLRVSRACQDGTREFTERRLRLARRLSGVAEKLAGSWKALGQGLNDAVGARQKFTRTSLKVSGRSLLHTGRSSEEDHETHRRECRIAGVRLLIKLGGHVWL